MPRKLGEKGERTRSRIIETAKSLFHLKGFTNTSMDEIVKESGVTKGNLYYYFASKEELGSAVVDCLITDLLSTGIRSGGRQDPVIQLIQMFEQAEEDLENMDCKGGCLFGNLALEVSDVHDGLRQKLQEALHRWEYQVERLLEGGKATGILKKDLHSGSTAHFIIAAFEGGILLTKVKKDVSIFRHCTSMMREVLDGLRV